MARQRKLSNPLLRTGLRCYYNNGDPPDMTDVCRDVFFLEIDATTRAMRSNRQIPRSSRALTVKFLGLESSSALT